MRETKKDLIRYRLARAWETFDDASISLKRILFLRNSGKYILSYLHGDKKGITMIYLTLTEIKFFPTLNRLKD